MVCRPVMIGLAVAPPVDNRAGAWPAFALHQPAARSNGANAQAMLPA